MLACRLATTSLFLASTSSNDCCSSADRAVSPCNAADTDLNLLMKSSTIASTSLPLPSLLLGNASLQPTPSALSSHVASRSFMPIRSSSCCIRADWSVAEASPTSSCITFAVADSTSCRSRTRSAWRACGGGNLGVGGALSAECRRMTNWAVAAVLKLPPSGVPTVALPLSASLGCDVARKTFVAGRRALVHLQSSTVETLLMLPQSLMEAGMYDTTPLLCDCSPAVARPKLKDRGSATITPAR
mmetsp:Transcript_45062/g.82376  ORF Transcript_45062/g.82376 Transcript_45062/m.82376 type:complete len:244 (+) Transcript_45062:1315-2046(+)